MLASAWQLGQGSSSTSSPLGPEVELVSLRNQAKVPPPTFLYVVMEARVGLGQGQAIPISTGRSVRRRLSSGLSCLATSHSRPLSGAWSCAAERVQGWMDAGAGGMAEEYSRTVYEVEPRGQGGPGTHQQQSESRAVTNRQVTACGSLLPHVFVRQAGGTIGNTFHPGLLDEVSVDVTGGFDEETPAGRLALARALWRAVCSKRHFKVLKESSHLHELEAKASPAEVRLGLAGSCSFHTRQTR